MATTKNRVVELRQVKASDLKRNPKNWRQHPKAQRDAMKGVLKEIGYAGALLARETPEGLVLIDGHLRADTTPGEMVPVLVLDLSEQEADKLLAVYDPLSAMAQPNMDVLLNLIKDMEFEDKSVNAMLEALANGETLPLPDRTGNTDPDDVPPAPEDPYVKLGDLWQLGDHRVLCGDSAIVWEAMLGDSIPVLTLTDPPYGIGIVKSGRVRQPGGRPSGVLSGKVGVKGVVEPRLYAPVTGDDRPFDPTWLLAVGKNQVIFGGSYFASHLRDGTTWLCWDKQIAQEATFSAFELAWTSFTGRMRIYRHTWSGMVRQGSRKEELKDRVHPTQKPVGLLGAIMGDFTEQHDVVFDPYLGSGSTLIAAEKLYRTCYGIEIEPSYVQVVIERWQDYTGQEATLLGNSEIQRVKS